MLDRRLIVLFVALLLCLSSGCLPAASATPSPTSTTAPTAGPADPVKPDPDQDIVIGGLKIGDSIEKVRSLYGESIALTDYMFVDALYQDTRYLRADFGSDNGKLAVLVDELQLRIVYITSASADLNAGSSNSIRIGDSAKKAVAYCEEAYRMVNLMVASPVAYFQLSATDGTMLFLTLTWKNEDGSAALTARSVIVKVTLTNVPTAYLHGSSPTATVSADQAFRDQLLSAADIGVVDAAQFRKIGTGWTYREALGLLGRTADLRHGQYAIYYVLDGDRYSLLTLPIMKLYATIDPADLELKPLGQTVIAALRGSYPFGLPSETELEDLIVQGAALDYLFTSYPLEFMLDATTTVDGYKTYYKVKPGQAYETLDQLSAALDRCFTAGAAQALLDRKTYVMVDGVLYSVLGGGHGGTFFRAGQTRFVDSIDVATQTMTVVTVSGNDQTGGGCLLTTILKRVDGAWKIDWMTPWSSATG
jgi:hypothetical protein